MPKTIISDTSCLIVLHNIDALDILQKLYGSIITTKDVADEFQHTLPPWISIQSPKDTQRQQILELQLDKGEASAIALALELKNCTLILDDNKARKIARQLGLIVTGTLGVIVKAKQEGVIRSVKPYISKLKERGFRLSDELEQAILTAAQEK